MTDTTDQAGAEETGLLCVCGYSVKLRPGLTLSALAALTGWTYYRNSPHKPTNALCPECRGLEEEN